jgi:hypothetical protein
MYAGQVPYSFGSLCANQILVRVAFEKAALEKGTLKKNKPENTSQNTYAPIADCSSTPASDLEKLS